VNAPRAVVSRRAKRQLGTVVSEPGIRRVPLEPDGRGFDGGEEAALPPSAAGRS
jgi:hypothetical protein